MYSLLSMSKCIQYSPTYVDLLKDKIKELLSLVYGPFQFLDDFILIFFKWCFKVCQQFATCKITRVIKKRIIQKILFFGYNTRAAKYYFLVNLLVKESNTSSYIKVLLNDDNCNEAVMFFKVTKLFLENHQDINEIFEIINEHLNIFQSCWMLNQPKKFSSNLKYRKTYL